MIGLGHFVWLVDFVCPARPGRVQNQKEDVYAIGKRRLGPRSTVHTLWH